MVEKRFVFHPDSNYSVGFMSFMERKSGGGREKFAGQWLDVEQYLGNWGERISFTELKVRVKEKSGGLVKTDAMQDPRLYGVGGHLKSEGYEFASAGMASPIILVAIFIGVLAYFLYEGKKSG